MPAPGEVAYTVSVLNNGTWVAPGAVIYLHPYGWCEPVEIVQNFFLVEGGGHTVLVDTGVDGLESFLAEEQLRRLGPPPSRTTSELLAEHGLEPEDIDTLILTHLHFDHYMNARLFSRARIVVNRSEFLYVLDAANGRYMPRQGFPREVFAWLVDQAWERLDLVEGETEVLPGIRVVETGGHSPGHQIVTVQTAAGLVVIPGDEVYRYDNLEQSIPIGYYYDFEKLIRAMDLLRSLAGHLLPAHDPAVHIRYPTLRIA
jgi:glyoxylase-like metal-dependent hydrolase (beta-lactamase superfamily II)